MSSEETKQKIAELESLRSQIRAWRIGTVLILLVIVLTCVWSVIHALRSLFREGPKQELFVQELATGFNDHVLPPAQTIAMEAFNELTPVVQDELKKLNARTPELVEALQKQGETLARNIPERAHKVLEAEFTGLMKSREAKIKKMFPNLSDDKVGELVNNLVQEGNAHMWSIVDDMFKPHEDAFQDILAHLYQIQEDEAANIKDEMPTWEMAILLFDAIRDDLKELDSMEYADVLEEANKTVTETVQQSLEQVVK